MGLLLPLVAALAVFSSLCDARLPKMFLGRPEGGFLRPPMIDHLSKEQQADIVSRLPPEQWFTQRLDHFQPTDSRTWRQRFFQTNGPAGSKTLFVLIQGEGPASSIWNVQSALAEYAKKYEASILQLEHRFYGKSHPTSDTSTGNLKYLSSEQALEDAANFIATMKEQLGAEKVIVFGGSYPGCLVAWFREKFPHLADGAVASSAPVLAQVDFKGYLEVVSNSLGTFQSAGSCDAAVKQANDELRDYMKTSKGRQVVQKLFNTCSEIDPSQPNDIYNMYSNLAGHFMEAVQYNRNSTPGVMSDSIHALCSPMTDTSRGSALERYASVTKLPGSLCLDIKYTDVVKELKEISWSSGRCWTYQTCTEFGYYQTTDSSAQPFGQEVPIDYYTQLCRDVFGPGFNATTIKQDVRATNVNYGAKNYAEDKIVFVNGGIDPWHYLGITSSLPQAPAIFIPGTSHCFDMYQSEAYDSPALTHAREQIVSLIGKWLSN